ncbi:cysteine--tRNA ligase [Blattabacterium cuenoti]|uniref:cysteine--tRNA ligase n=1 Tax=Blattabacterium cuenoti TaxID=1653831 RepID=UPI00163BDCB7|nr:cysteine--tRNA ligase [Blattabacterium cuenoti]
MMNKIINNLKIYNSLTKKKELFNPINNKNVGIYVCGPTVYNHLHLGNYRTFIIFDIIFRYLKHIGYKVRYVRNITDVGHLENDEYHNHSEDKISKRSRIEGIEPMEIVQKYTISFHKVLNTLNLLPPSIEPTATGHIIEQIEIIKKFIDKKLAYENKGSVYFNLKQYEKLYPYGVISNNNVNNLFFKKKNFNHEKLSPHDFCIWKNASDKHIMKWNSPWGKGFPGWHTECMVMSTKYLGSRFDIHGGGIDLKFPHHESELAQSNGFYNTQNSFAKYWIHTNMLTINGKKMSKSLGNFISANEIFSKTISSPNVFKLFILQFHYRNILNFSLESLKIAEKGYLKIKKSIKILKYFIPNNNLEDPSSEFKLKNWIYNCYHAINDDFNTPLLISHLFKATNFINSSSFSEKITKYNFKLLKKYMIYFIFDILGFIEIKKELSEENSKNLDILIKNLIKFREKMRIQKQWIISDKIRKELFNIGILIKDKKL